MAKMPRTVEFCTQEPHFEGEEVLVLRSAKQIYPLDLNTNQICMTESTFFVHKLGQGPLELEVLVTT